MKLKVNHHVYKNLSFVYILSQYTPSHIFTPTALRPILTLSFHILIFLYNVLTITGGLQKEVF